MKRKGELTKQRILAVSGELFWYNGYHSTSVDLIVNTAGVNKASFYQYFINKEDVLRIYLENQIEHFIQLIYKPALQESDSPIHQLALIFKKHYKIQKKEKLDIGYCPGCPFVNIGSELGNQNEEIRNIVLKAFSNFQKSFKQISVESHRNKLSSNKQKSNTLGNRLFMVLNGGITMAKINNKPEEIQSALKTAEYILIGNDN